jgi:hypothetical protein
MVDPVHADIDRRIEVIDGPKDGLVWHVSDLRALPFVVLLGEPGIGKSTVLGDEAAHEGRHIIKVRELMTGPPVAKARRFSSTLLTNIGPMAGRRTRFTRSRRR